MLIISHRGNINGANPSKENKPEYIIKAFDDFDVEIDLWRLYDELYLGHNEPTYKISFDFLYTYQDKLWIHCKNVQAAKYFFDFNFKYFWHQTDDIAITSNFFLWTFTGKPLTSKSIAVLPERISDWDISKAFGICTDYPQKYKNGTYI